jgi:hypothetical protein
VLYIVYNNDDDDEDDSDDNKYSLTIYRVSQKNVYTLLQSITPLIFFLF